jgi:hypothetical protein
MMPSPPPIPNATMETPTIIAGHGGARGKVPDEAFDTAFAGWRRSLAAHRADETASQDRRADHWQQEPMHYRQYSGR